LHLHASALVKRFDDFLAVDDVGFSLESGEFLSLLGPSGCGKTTTLRMIAGFSEPDAGRISLAGTDITNMPARRRNIGMVFQNYALFPHMSVSDNIAFGLKMRSVERAEASRRTRRALEMVQMEPYEGSRPAELSGGQQQRIALARALVIEPSLLLLDEPLSALDLKLREELREEISRITRELKITTVFVTHDQNEALVLSDKVAVMNRGRIEQLDTPENLYQRPATPFVARFLGGANVIEGDLIRSGRRLQLRVAPEVVFDLEPDRLVQEGGRIAVAIRPEEIALVDGGDPGSIGGVVRQSRYLGGTREYRVELDPQLTVNVRSAASSTATVGDRVTLHIPPSAVVALEGTDSAAETAR
jgi:putative spermidine/putrescine transport system ATP-binding protein